jgi:hypothetical protein
LSIPKDITWNQKNIFFVFLALLLSSLKLSAQVPFIEIINQGSSTLTYSELAKYNMLDQEGQNISKWVVNINPIQDYLQGNQLTIQKPEGGGSITFTAIHVSSMPNGSYYWTGVNADGSTFRLGKYPTGYLGSLYIASSSSMYSILNRVVFA